MLVGRVTKHLTTTGDADFTLQVRVGDFVYYRTSQNKKVMCQVTRLHSTPRKGLHGKFEILEPLAEMPKTWANLFLAQQKTNGYIEVGVTDNRKTVNLRVNPFFRHTLVAGKTGRGKTHVQIVLAEEFVKHKVPSLIFDTQGEFIHLEDAVIVTELNFEDLIAHLKFKKTVVYNLQGLSYQSKPQRCHEILSRLMREKERDYQHAENDIRLLEIPPLIVNIDEAEIYAPKHLKKISSKECREALCDIAERGGKYGIGLVIGAQRLPALHPGVSSQCNNGVIFHVSDQASKNALKHLPYITSLDLRHIKNLPRGQCIVTGEVVSRSVLLTVRDIKTRRAKNLDFEQQLGLTPSTEEEPDAVLSEEEFESFLASMQKGITMEQLESKFPTREVPIHGKCVVIPERYFKKEWKNTFEAQGLKVVHCPDMPGGDVYLVRRDKHAVRAKIKEMARKHVKPVKTGRDYLNI